MKPPRKFWVTQHFGVFPTYSVSTSKPEAGAIANAAIIPCVEKAAVIEHLNILKEAMEMGAFHHSACAANWYSEDTKGNWDGTGDHREPQGCTCAKEKVDRALESLDKFLGDIK